MMYVPLSDQKKEALVISAPRTSMQKKPMQPSG